MFNVISQSVEFPLEAKAPSWEGGRRVEREEQREEKETVEFNPEHYLSGKSADCRHDSPIKFAIGAVTIPGLSASSLCNKLTISE